MEKIPAIFKQFEIGGITLNHFSLCDRFDLRFRHLYMYILYIFFLAVTGIMMIPGVASIQ